MITKPEIFSFPTKWVYLVLCGLGVLCCMNIARAEQFGDFNYTVNGTAVTITGYQDTAAETIEIPAMIDGKEVISIGDNAFQSLGLLIGVTIPSGVTGIGYRAFYNCIKLASVTIPDGVTSIGIEAFAYCKLTNVTLPASLTSLGSAAFVNCAKLGSLTLSPNLTTIAASTFFGCSTLTGVTIPGTVTSIGNSAFQYCSSLTSMTIPSGVISLGNKVFYQCPGLTSVSIPATVTLIGTEVFAKSGALVSIAVSVDNPNFSDLNGVLFNKSQTTLVAYPGGLSGGYAIPTGVTTIGSKAFFNCAKLTGVTVPSSVISIGQQAFSTCGTLLYANFSGDAPTMGSGVFELAAIGFKVYYFNGASGFPDWLTYTTVDMGTSTPIVNWFLSEGLPYDSSLSSDSNGDGVNLLMAYALGLNPNHNLSGSMPKPVFEANQMKLSFQAGASGVTYVVETSTDLEHWDTEGVSFSDADGIRTASVPRDETNRFMRLSVSH